MNTDIYNELFIGIKLSAGGVLVFSLIEIRGYYVLNLPGLDNCGVVNLESKSNKYSFNNIRLFEVGDSIDLGIDEKGNRVYAVVDDSNTYNGYFSYRTEHYCDINKHTDYVKYRNRAIKYEMSGIQNKYHWMEGDIFINSKIQGKIMDGTVLLLSNIENSRNSAKFNRMVIDGVKLINSSINIGTLVSCSRLEIERSTLNVDRVAVLFNRIEVRYGFLNIAEIDRSINVSLDNSVLKIGENAEASISNISAIKSRIDISRIEMIENISIEDSEVRLGGFDCIVIESCENTRFIFTNPSIFGNILVCSGAKIINCSFEFPNGMPVNNLNELLGVCDEHKIAIKSVEEE